MRHFPAVKVGRLPERVAVFRLHGQQQRLWSSGGKDNSAFINQGTLAGVPGRHSGAILPDQIYSPAQFTREGIETDHVAFGPHSDDELISYGRYRA